MKKYIRALLTKIFRLIRGLTGYTPPKALFKHLHFVGPFSVKLPDGKSVRLFSWGDRIENETAWAGWNGYEPLERQRWYEIVSLGGDVLDVGANTATFAIFAKKFSSNARVFAFEALERIAQKAKYNIDVAGVDVEVINSAIGRENGEMLIHDPGGDNAYSASLDPNFLSQDCKKYSVPVLSLDNFCKINQVNPKAIKIDVEGFEGEVICGSSNLLDKGECIILCEWLGASESQSEAKNLLLEKGYIALEIEGLTEIDVDSVVNYDNRNIILVHKHNLNAISALGIK